MFWDRIAFEFSLDSASGVTFIKIGRRSVREYHDLPVLEGNFQNMNFFAGCDFLPYNRELH